MDSTYRRVRRAAPMFLLAVGAACGDARTTMEQLGDVDVAWAPEQLREVAGVPIAALRQAIGARLDAERPPRVSEDQWTHVRTLYETFDGAPLWMTERGLHGRRTRIMLEALADADLDALALSEYPLVEIGEAVLVVRRERRPAAEQLAEADVMLTAAFAAMGEDMLKGQIDPRSVSRSWHINPHEREVDSLLARTLRADPLDGSLAQLRPSEPEYDVLRGELAKYRELVANGGWPVIPAGKLLRRGVSDDAGRIAAVRARLRAEGYLPEHDRDSAREAERSGDAPPAGGSAAFDQEMAGAIARFQARHAIVVDSMIGPETLAALNRPAEYRLGQIAANMERYRWLPQQLGDKYVFVNVPAFRLDAYENGQRVLDMRVIVGAEYDGRDTPVFSDSMQFVVFRPYWFIPDGIAERDIWPQIAADPGYMARKHYETFEDGGQTRLRQRPGSHNSLGLIKFMFPNDFAIYLHDTPSGELFREDVRAFSNGCIRVERPVELAQFVMGWEPERIRSAMRSGRDDRRINLERKVPVYIVYFTAYSLNGELHFGNDLYLRDDALVHVIAPAAQPGPDVERAAAALRELAGR